ncbi:MAG: endonuclease/exonuclease/phosphatase family protein [Acidimicrobiia bacterium]
MTANLLNDKADPADLAGILDRLQPDLVVTQELGPGAAEVIADRFAHHDLRPEIDHRGRGIASQLPARFGEIPLPWRPGLWGEMEVGPRRLVLATVHMRNPTVLPWWTSVRIRGRQLDALFDWAESVGRDETLVVAGDMNASPSWPVYKRLAGRWDDLVAASALSSGAEIRPTWAWRPGWPRMLRIDHVFGTGARVVTTRVEPVRGSDHAAVIVDLELVSETG